MEEPLADASEHSSIRTSRPVNGKRQNNIEPNLQPVAKHLCFETANPFSVLSVDDNNDITDVDVNNKDVRPPPIMIHNVLQYDVLRKSLIALIGNEFSCSISTKIVTVRPNTPSAYRKVITYLNNSSAEYHTYQLPDEKPYRIVVRGLHSTTNIDDIKQEIETHEHKVRAVVNVISREKVALPLFFVDLEPAPNNPSVFEITNILHCKIKIEEPRNNKTVPQCTRCQTFSHTKSYCSRKPKCVKCGGDHFSNECNKSRDSPATCANCGLSHTANYRGCAVYKELQRKRHTQTQKTHSNNQNEKNLYRSAENRPLQNQNRDARLQQEMVAGTEAPFTNSREAFPPLTSNRDPRLLSSSGLLYNSHRQHHQQQEQRLQHQNQNAQSHQTNLDGAYQSGNNTYLSYRDATNAPRASSSTSPDPSVLQPLINVFITEIQKIIQPLVTMLAQLTQNLLAFNGNGR
jgi:hypothetical protein